jgi:hypothetical protein
MNKPSRLLDAIEYLGESAVDSSVPYVHVSIQVASDDDVDRVHRHLGSIVDGALSMPPDFVGHEGQTWRQSRTTIAGVEVTIHGPHRAAEKAKAA